MPRVKEELLAALTSACNSNASAKSLCILAGLSTDGSQATKRARLAAIVEGPMFVSTTAPAPLDEVSHPPPFFSYLLPFNSMEGINFVFSLCVVIDEVLM